MTRQTFRLVDGKLVEKRTGETFRGEGIALPMIMRDIPEYRSPIDGSLITSRSARREDLKRNNCVEFEPSATTVESAKILRDSKGRPQFKNPKFAKKYNLPLHESVKDAPRN